MCSLRNCDTGEFCGGGERTLDTVESFAVGYGQGTNTNDWMKPPGDLFLYCDMKDLGADMVFQIGHLYFHYCR